MKELKRKKGGFGEVVFIFKLRSSHFSLIHTVDSKNFCAWSCVSGVCVRCASCALAVCL